MFQTWGKTYTLFKDTKMNPHYNSIAYNKEKITKKLSWSFLGTYVDAPESFGERYHLRGERHLLTIAF